MRPGDFHPVPDIESPVSPVTAEGRIVCDASIPYLGIGIPDAPVTLEVRDGKVVSITGGRAADTVRAGKTMLLFPEGTRSTDGAVHEFKSTLGHLALTTRVDILPVHLGGTYESWPKGRRFPIKREITARIGPPLLIGDLERLTGHLKFAPACRAVASIARAAVVALSRGTVLELGEVGTLAANPQGGNSNGDGQQHQCPDEGRDQPALLLHFRLLDLRLGLVQFSSV